MINDKQEILIVEDEEPLREALVQLLTKKQFKVTLAKNGEEGLSMAIKNPPDIILLDILIPKIDGLTVLRKLQDHRKTRNIPVLIMTNLADTRLIIEGLDFGIDATGKINTNSGFRSKPLNKDECKNVTAYFNSRLKNNAIKFIVKRTASLHEIIGNVQELLSLDNRA